MTVHCPHCATGYLLPDHLVGSRGARVRCPACEGAFVVIPDNGHALPSADGERRSNGVPPAAATPDPAIDRPLAPENGEPPADAERIASEILDALAARLGDTLTAAREERRVLSRHGPALLDAYDDYRLRAGGAGAEPFLKALRERWGIGLEATRAR